MADSQSRYIDISELRIGHYVYLDLGWMSHPFPLNSFKVQSQDQIDTLKSLGLEQVRYSPERSDPAVLPDGPRAAASPDITGARDEIKKTPENELPLRSERVDLLLAQQMQLKLCERQFNQASRAYRQVAEIARQQPAQARQQLEALIQSFVSSLLTDDETCIRLLSEQVGERASLHAINVTVISLLLGQACGLNEQEMFDLGIGALLHDIGKRDLPDRLRLRDENFSQAEHQFYQQHVAYGVTVGQKMNLSSGALLAIAQHHEMADGSGYPQRLQADRISTPARVLALVNVYDNLCNPNNPGASLTPHEALSQIFAQKRNLFDSRVLGIFIRMMGVYPPGSVVQLSDGSYALVVSVNSVRPLKPRVIIHRPEIPKDEALVIDLESHPELSIRRSLRPMQLPHSTIDYLSPRERICYFFEHGRDGALAPIGGTVGGGIIAGAGS